MWTDEQINIGKQLFLAIERSQTEVVRSLCTSNPWLATDHRWNDEDTWLDPAVTKGDLIMLATLIDLGFSVNALNLCYKSTALSTAIGNMHFDVARFLLSRRANPNLSRCLIAAINLTNRNSEKIALEYVKLLIEHGIDVNQLFPLYGDKNKLSTALDWAEGKPEITHYLRAHGAKTASEIQAESGKTLPTQANMTASYAEEVVAYFNNNVGPVNKHSQIEIVPAGEPVAIHAVEPDGEHSHLTLFTTGLSAKAMSVPEGKEEFAMAELYIQLPGDWRFNQMNDPKYVWPAFWLRKIARYPRENGTWLAGPLTIIANDDPPQPLAPNLLFTSLMLFADKSFVRQDGNTVQLYRVVPLYAEERALELRDGIPALLRAFDRNGIPFEVDLKRKNAGL